MQVIINRQVFEDKQTLGTMQVFEGAKEWFSCKTLELEEDSNQARDDCIPRGEYVVVKRWSQRFGNHFWVKDVPGREWILIHAGNYYTQIRGCILVGSEFRDINGDGYRDVINSKVTLIKLLNILPDQFKLTIQ